METEVVWVVWTPDYRDTRVFDNEEAAGDFAARLNTGPVIALDVEHEHGLDDMEVPA